MNDQNRGTPADELGAHISTAGGVDRAPPRAREIGSRVLQLFTKQPSRWAEPNLTPEMETAYCTACSDHEIRGGIAHDSYLINLATGDPVLYERSYRSFVSELQRSSRLRLDFVVTHPGNATDGDFARGLAQNAAAIEQALHEVPGNLGVLIETTAGGGRVLGAKFEEIAEMIGRIGPEQRQRVGVCFDTCHVWAAGYDLVGDYDGVIRRFDDLIGLEKLRLFHLNDSVGGLGSRRDRHAWIGDGTLGLEPFRRIMTDDRLAEIPKLLETPKGDDHSASDRENLRRLRALRSG